MMASFYKGTIPIIDDSVESVGLAFPKMMGRGYVERDYNLYPQEMFAPSDIPAIPRSEWDARYDEQEEQKSSLEHLYLSGPGGAPRFVNLDQNGHGYCWIYSDGHADMMIRLRDNQPIVRLNPHAGGAIIKGGRDEGGWCGLGAKFLREVGLPTEEFWPRHSLDLKHDTPAMRANAALHRVTEDWMDLGRQDWNHELTELQIATCGFMNNPVPQDFQWWGHSVCGIRWVRIEAGSWGPLILNSWLGWGRHGLAVLQGSKARCMGAVALRVSGASTT